MSKDQADIRHKEMMRLFYKGYSVMDAFIMTALIPWLLKKKSEENAAEPLSRSLKLENKSPPCHPVLKNQ